MKLLYLKCLRNVINPDEIIVTHEEAFKKNVLSAFEIPDESTDYFYDPISQYLYYVLDGKIHNIFVPNAGKDI